MAKARIVNTWRHALTMPGGRASATPLGSARTAHVCPPPGWPGYRNGRRSEAKRLMDATLDHNIERRRALVANGHKLALAACASGRRRRRIKCL